MEENEPVLMRMANLHELIQILDNLLHGIHETVQSDENSGWFDKVSDVSASLKDRIDNLKDRLLSIANQIREQYLQILSKDLKQTSVMDIIENLYTINGLAVNLQYVIDFDIKTIEKTEETTK